MSSWQTARNAAVSLALMGLGFLIAALIAEVFLRVFFKDSITLFPRYHTVAEYGEYRLRRHRPNSEFSHTSIDGRWQFQTNGSGLRMDRDLPYEKPPGVLRVLALGDSHTNGYEVRQDETFSAVLETVLRDSGSNAEVINAGISGFGTAEQLVYLEQEGLRYEPDVVVVGFYGNDFADNIKSGLFALEDGELVVRKTEHLPGVGIQDMIYSWWIIRFLSENSYFYSFGFNMAYEAAKAALAAASKREVQAEYAVQTTEVSNYENELMAALMARLGQVCRDNNITLVVADIPRVSTEEIITSVSADVRPAFDAAASRVLYAEDLYADFAGREDDIHVPHGHRHIGAEAHASIARAVAKVIAEAQTSPAAGQNAPGR